MVDDLKLYILSRGRAERQPTLDTLPHSLRCNATLVVPTTEADAYKVHGVDVLCVPRSVWCLPMKRQWLLRYHNRKGSCQKIVMLDDDMGFAVRRLDHPGRFRQATARDVLYMFREVSAVLNEYAHAGVLAREGSGHTRGARFYCTRAVRLHGYDVDVLLRERIRMDRLVAMEDFDTTLQLLRKGHPNVILGNYCHGQGRSDAPGGCSIYRTPEVQRETALKLAELHAPFVKVVEKRARGEGRWSTRTDVVVSWKKAYASSQR